MRRVGLLLLATASLSCALTRGIPSAPTQAESCEANEESHSYYALPGLDHGLIQSPVNILSDATDEGSHAVHLAFERRGTRSIVNKGHTVELQFPRGLAITFDDRTYEAIQTHFHTPSEHRIDGVTYPMEMHVVSTAPPLEPEGPPEYLVVSLLFRMGPPNPFIEDVLRTIPSNVGVVQSTQPLIVADLFEGGRAGLLRALHSFFHYRGSLTTPPYSETVEWLVLKHVFTASPAQIEALNAIEGDNARPIQMLFGRSIDE